MFISQYGHWRENPIAQVSWAMGAPLRYFKAGVARRTYFVSSALKIFRLTFCGHSVLDPTPASSLWSILVLPTAASLVHFSVSEILCVLFWHWNFYNYVASDRSLSPSLPCGPQLFTLFPLWKLYVCLSLLLDCKKNLNSEDIATTAINERYPLSPLPFSLPGWDHEG